MKQSPDVFGTVADLIILFMTGVIISPIGAMAGLGGGFLAVPFLVFVWGVDRDLAVLVSLFMIFANSVSNSISYVRARMVDYRTVTLLAIPAVPGLFIGYYLLRNMDDSAFDLAFSVLLFSVTLYILISRGQDKGRKATDGKAPEGRPPLWKELMSMPLGFVAGIASSAFGIGGGAILMPVQIGLLGVAVKRAIAASMFVLMVITGIRVVMSVNDLDLGLSIPLALGAVVGGQIAPFLVKRAKSLNLLYLLSAFLFLIAMYMAFGAVRELFF